VTPLGKRDLDPLLDNQIGVLLDVEIRMETVDGVGAEIGAGCGRDGGKRRDGKQQMPQNFTSGTAASEGSTNSKYSRSVNPNARAMNTSGTD